MYTHLRTCMCTGRSTHKREQTGRGPFRGGVRSCAVRQYYSDISEQKQCIGKNGRSCIARQPGSQAASIEFCGLTKSHVFMGLEIEPPSNIDSTCCSSHKRPSFLLIRGIEPNNVFYDGEIEPPSN